MSSSPRSATATAPTRLLSRCSSRSRFPSSWPAAGRHGLDGRLTTVGTIVAHGGLGNLLSDGFDTNFKAEILAASLLCVVLAVVLDVLLVGVQWLATPWTRAKARA